MTKDAITSAEYAGLAACRALVLARMDKARRREPMALAVKLATLALELEGKR